jgi:hypothetical protein
MQLCDKSKIHLHHSKGARDVPSGILRLLLMWYTILLSNVEFPLLTFHGRWS